MKVYFETGRRREKTLKVGNLLVTEALFTVEQPRKLMKVWRIL